MPIPNPLARKNEHVLQNETHEMVLLTLVRAEENAHSPSAADLARELNLTRAVLDAHLTRLVEQGLAKTSLDGTLSLTTVGREQALGLLRRHRLAERLFTDVLGLDWVEAHAQADRLEHLVSPQAEEQLATQLGDPETCPHGNPIPNAKREPVQSPALSLYQCPLATPATITRIGLETPAALQHLATLGLLPQIEIEVENRAPFNGPVMVRIGRAHYALGRDLASRIWVRPC